MLMKRVIIFVTVLETPHTLVGAAIASKIPNPYIALPLALISHLVLEKVPHWNPHLNTEKSKFGKVTPRSFKIIVIDASIALISGTLIASQKLPNYSSAAVVMAACFFSVLPDLVEAPYFFLNWDNKYTQKWIAFQKSIQSDAGVKLGLATQVVFSLAALYWIYS